MAPSPVHQGPEGCLGERHGVGTQSQTSGGTTVRVGVRFNLGTEDRWQYKGGALQWGLCRGGMLG